MNVCKKIRLYESNCLVPTTKLQIRLYESKYLVLATAKLHWPLYDCKKTKTSCSEFLEARRGIPAKCFTREFLLLMCGD